jgi:DNA-binding NtrC family response regulator
MARVLLMDDDAELSQFLQEELEAQGHRVQCLERAERGPEVLAETPFDVVLLDNKMPGMSGIEFLEALRDRGLDVPVILMTGYSAPDTVIKAMNLGAVECVIKPDDFQTLVRELEPLIRKAPASIRPVKSVQGAAEAPPHPPDPVLIGKSKVMVEVYKLIGLFAASDNAVLILGETGTGKELVARGTHSNSPRKHRPFVALNCAAIPENLLESELFGHEKGAFTGAERRHIGKFEQANGGTLFLDEVGDMPLALQAKLLRVLEDQVIERVGGDNEPIKVNVRLLSATRRDLKAAIQAGKFREDLYYRLNVLKIELPPLRLRLEDLPDLAAYYLTRAAEDTGRPRPTELAPSALDKLRRYRWPGNVRELRNVIYRAFSVCRGSQVLPADLDFAAEGSAGQAAANGADEAAAALQKAICWAWDAGQPELWPRLRDLLERELLKTALDRLERNQTQVAERLDMARNTVSKRMQKYGLE